MKVVNLMEQINEVINFFFIQRFAEVAITEASIQSPRRSKRSKLDLNKVRVMGEFSVLLGGRQNLSVNLDTFSKCF